MAVKPIPEGYHAVTPYLVAERAGKLVDFLKQAFGAEETFRMAAPDGSIMHAEIKIGDSMLMLGEASEQWKPMPCALYLYLKDSDAVYKRALQAGGTSIMEPADQFYGDRHGGVKDPSGNTWWIATHKEDVSPEELKKRSEEFMKQKAGEAH
jgi:PhnB protein